MSNCGACDTGTTHFCVAKGGIQWGGDQTFRNEWIDRRVESEYHPHPIVPWAVEESCYFCGYHASHKVGEEDTNPSFHNMTAYVCCNHFWSTCRNTQATDYANGHTYDRT